MRENLRDSDRVLFLGFSIEWHGSAGVRMIFGSHEGDM